jgi:N6-L-threonylcarbamoyladenine synthase
MTDVVLGIETSCDETSAAILVADGSSIEIASNVILSQDIHDVFGGVVPELASRAHLRTIGPVIDEALNRAGLPIAAVDGIAVTAGPGLVGALLVGVCYGKALAYAHEKRLIGVNHLEGHVFAATLDDPMLKPPFVALLVSGGHTMLLDVPDWGTYRLLGKTRDDAAGEAFDKVAKLLKLGYPGGPLIESLAESGTDRFNFPRPMINDGFDFSFSGLKTAVLHAVRRSEDLETDSPDLATSFQAAAFDVLTAKVRRAIDLTGRDTVVLGGGVACSRTLQSTMTTALKGHAHVTVSRPSFNTDNAAMIARAGWFHLSSGRRDTWELDANSRLPWPGLNLNTNVPSTPS